LSLAVALCDAVWRGRCTRVSIYRRSWDEERNNTELVVPITTTGSEVWEVASFVHGWDRMY